MTTSNPNSFGTFLDSLGPDIGTATVQDAAETVLGLLANNGPMPLAKLHEDLRLPFSVFMSALTTLMDTRIVQIADDEPATVRLTRAGESLARVRTR